MNWWLRYRDSSLPYQDHCPFPDDAIVQARSYFWPEVPDTIALAKHLWWGYESDFGEVGEGVIAKARRLDRSLIAKPMQ